MKKLVNIQSNWFIGNEYRVHHVPDNSIILRVILENHRREVLFYEYDFNFEAGIRRGLLFEDTGKNAIHSDNIGFWPYYLDAFLHKLTFTVNSEYKALNSSESPLADCESVTISGSKWSIIKKEYMTDDATLITLREVLEKAK